MAQGRRRKSECYEQAQSLAELLGTCGIELAIEDSSACPRPC